MLTPLHIRGESVCGTDRGLGLGGCEPHVARSLVILLCVWSMVKTLGWSRSGMCGALIERELPTTIMGAWTGAWALDCNQTMPAPGSISFHMLARMRCSAQAPRAGATASTDQQQ